MLKSVTRFKKRLETTHKFLYTRQNPKKQWSVVTNFKSESIISGFANFLLLTKAPHFSAKNDVNMKLQLLVC